MLVDDGRITWLGAADAVPEPAPDTRVDLGDATVIPGLIDSHQHLMSWLWLANWIDCRDCRSPEAVAGRLRERAPSVPEGPWIVGWGYDAGAAEGGRRATRWQLDAVSEDRPVLLVESSFHQGCANSAALTAVGWNRDTPRRWGGELERDRRGEHTGMAWEKAFSVLELAARRAELDTYGASASARVADIVQARLAEGLTHVSEALATADDVAVLTARSWPIGFTLMTSSSHGSFTAPWDALDGPRTGEGDPATTGIGHLKLFSDGAERAALSLPVLRTIEQTATMLRRAFRSRDAAGLRVLTGAKASISGGRLVSGTLLYPPGRMADLVSAALEKGFLVAVHALGNRGVSAALDALEEARRRTGIDVAGCRLEHAMFVEDRDIERAASMRLVFSMQPGHAVHYARTLVATGVDRVLDPVALRKVLDGGVRLAISSDGPTAPGTALDNMRAAVDRLTPDGTVMRGDLAITREEALRAATLGGAEACGVDALKGSLEPGKQADFAVLTGDPFDPATRVVEAWVAGTRVFARADSQAS